MNRDPIPVWEALLAAAHGESGDGAPRQWAVDGGTLVLHRSGRWQADFEPADDVRTMLDSLASLAIARRFTVAQLGQSLDGRIATTTGHSHYINGSVARTHLHRLRALVDAVVVGASTACTDHPRLTVRGVSGPDPVAVIIDPRGRVPATGPLFEPAANNRPVLHLVGPRARAGPAPAHVERVQLQSRAGRFAPSAVIEALHARGLHRILVEGGADTVSRFVDANALDRLHLLIAPLIIGSGRNGLDLPAIDRLDEARRPRIRSFRLGDELLVEVFAREPSCP